MSCTQKHHKVLTNGVGKCSVPMWCNGMPSGFCDEPAYSEPPKSRTFRIGNGEERREDGRYNGYVPALACPNHGGFKKEEVLNLCEFCQNHIAECSGNPKFGTDKGNDNVYECGSFLAKGAK